MTGQRRTQVKLPNLLNWHELWSQARFVLLRLHAWCCIARSEHDVNRPRTAFGTQDFKHEGHPRRVDLQAGFLEHLAPRARRHALASAGSAAG